MLFSSSMERVSNIAGSTRSLGRPRVTLPALMVFLSGMLICVQASVAETKAATGRPPNILFIMADDHGINSTSCYGADRIQTPHIDRIAREGMRFDKAYVTNSICGPSRATILTGKYAHLNGYWRNNAGFDTSQNTFPKLLSRVGYQTAVIGKWHLDADPVMFDHFDVLIDQGTYYNPVMRTNRGGNIFEAPHTGHSTEIITNKTLSWLRADRDPERPFMLMYHFKAPHRPWQPSPEMLDEFNDGELPEPDTLFEDFSGRGPASTKNTMSIARDLDPGTDLKLAQPHDLIGEQLRKWNAHYEPLNQAYKEAKLEGKDDVRWKYQRYAKDYLRTIKGVDQQLGRVLEYLDESGLAENTIVVYTSDNGWYLGEYGWYDKRWMYELSLRVPLVIRWPGHIKPSSINEEIVSNLDFAPTFLEAAGAAIPADIQGRSILPLLRGESPDGWRESFYYHYLEGLYSWHSVPRHYGVTTGRHKLIHFYELGDEWEFYDLENDPKELTNQYDNPEFAGEIAKAKKELARLREHYQVPAEDPLSFEEARRLGKSGPARAHKE
jgi:arylsulfatase A-like enzyme